jgi:hypothetical protein
MMCYEKSIEIKMQRPFATLSEKDRRIEAAKLGHGGNAHFSWGKQQNGNRLTLRFMEVSNRSREKSERSQVGCILRTMPNVPIKKVLVSLSKYIS